MVDLQLEDELIIMKISVIVEVLVALHHLLSHPHRPAHLHQALLPLPQLLPHRRVAYLNRLGRWNVGVMLV